MKRKLIIISIIILIVVPFFLKNNQKTKIDTIINSKSYSYLSNQAKGYVKEVYDKTGEIPLTEKNKVANKPYLNPEYLKYLELGKEKEFAEVIPKPYTIDYSYNEAIENKIYPKKYDLRNLDGKIM